MSYGELEYGNGNFLVTFDVLVRNVGQVKLPLRRARDPAYPRSETGDSETLKYGADLLLRRVRNNAVSGEAIQWFTKDLQTSPLAGDIECDLASEYEIGGETEFWIEPGESYHLSTVRVLPSGYYLAMVTLVGDASDEEFWRRVFTVRVPTAIR